MSKEYGYDLLLGYAESDLETVLTLSSVLDPRQGDGLFVVGDFGTFQDDRTVNRVHHPVNKLERIG